MNERVQQILAGVLGIAVIVGVGFWLVQNKDSMFDVGSKVQEASSSDPNQPPPEFVTVESVIDGITVRTESGHMIRYLGVRTPSVGEKVQCFGREAVKANESVIGKELRLETDPLLGRSSDGAWVRYAYMQPDEQEQVKQQNQDEQSEEPTPSPSASPVAPNIPNPEELNAKLQEALPGGGEQEDAQAEEETSNDTQPAEEESNTEEQENSSEEDEPEEIFVNERILEGGFGFPVVSKDMKYGDRMMSAARYASATGKGLWGQCEVSDETGQLQTQTVDKCVIKGKVTSDFEKIYRTPECSAYKQTVVLESQGGQWFCAEDIAQDAGFERASDCPSE